MPLKKEEKGMKKSTKADKFILGLNQALKFNSAAIFLVSMLLLSSCENSEQREREREPIDDEKISQQYQKVKEELKSAGAEIKEEAKEIKQELKESIHPGRKVGNDSSEL